MPYIFLPGKVLQLGLNKAQAAWLVATIGITDTAFRLITGFIGSVFKNQVSDSFDLKVKK